jgi:diguanylate cyclase (GGDEF)-like protein
LWILAAADAGVTAAPGMTLSQTLLVVVLIQQSLFGVVWLIQAHLRMAVRPALHWAAASWMVALGMAFYVARGSASDWLTVVLANLLTIGALVSLRRGVQLFASQPTTDREHALVLGLTGTGLAAVVMQGEGYWFVAMLASAALAWTLGRCALEVRRHFAVELSPRAATWCAAPFAATALMFTARTGVTLIIGPHDALNIAAPGAANVAMAFASVVLGLVLNMNLIGLSVMRLVRQLQYQSDHDVVTGLLSRRAMQRLLDDESRRQQRSGVGFAVLSIDIDHFKRINDRYGHAAGDAVLARLAQALRQTAREVDRVARMGGEEFCMLLPATDRVGAETAAQRLLEAARVLQHPELGSSEVVTVSIGLAEATRPDEALALLLQRLDRALYAAKHAGRDRFELAEPAAAG